MTRGYYEDFSVGDVIHSPESYEITPERLHQFAAEFDPQPMHVDADAARASFFGELVASGWQTLAVTMRLMVLSPLFASGQVVGVSVDKARWLRPVRPGDVLSARAQVTGMRPAKSRPGHGYLFVTITTVVDGASEPVATQEVTMLVPRRSQRE